MNFRSDMTVMLRDSMGGDQAVIEAMLVSTEDDEIVQEMLEEKTTYGRINFLMKNRHGTPFEHNAMKFYMEMPIFVFREFHRHRVGWCLPGDAKIAVGTWRNGQTKRIADVYRDWHEGVPDTMGRSRLLPSCRNLVTRTLNLDTGVIEAARMVDVYESGIKPIIRIELASGRTLRCTPEHQVWSQDGWVKAGDVQINNVLGRQGRVAVGERQGIPKRLREGIQVWTTEQKPDLIKPVDQCYVCGGVFPADVLELDHFIPVRDDLRLALDVDNLRPICVPCHQVKTNTEGFEYGLRRRALTLGVRYEQVVSVRSDGEEMTYDIEMPAPWHNFVADNFIVHNSYNEMSGRYRELPPTFYVPDEHRKLFQVGKPGHYEFVEAPPEAFDLLTSEMRRSYESAYATYQDSLKAGIAKEVARMVLPVGIYSAQYATCNARSLMSFLSLRTKDENSTFPSYPQREIEMVAEKMEKDFSYQFPMTYRAFCENGRVSP